MTKIFPFLCLSTLLLLVGCASTPNVADYEERITLSPQLPGHIKVEEYQTGQNSAGLLTVNLAMVNDGSRNVDVAYKITWLANGAAVDTVTGTWNRSTLRPREPVYLSLIAPRLDIDNFDLVIRPAN